MRGQKEYIGGRRFWLSIAVAIVGVSVGYTAVLAHGGFASMQPVKCPATEAAPS